MTLARTWNAALRAAPLRVWAIVLAGPALCTAAAVMVGIIWRGDWPETLAGKRLDYLGWALLVLLVNVTMIIVALTAVKVKARGAVGEFEVGGNNDAPDSNRQMPPLRRSSNDDRFFEIQRPHNTYLGDRE